MRVEVDVSDLDELDYYIDNKCEQLERVLRNDSRFAEYRVKRQHCGGDGELDPFVIQDDDGVDLITLGTLEIDTLSETELLSSIDIEMRCLECSENYVLFLLATIVLTPVAIINSGMVIIYYSNLNLIRTLILTLAVVLFAVISGAMYYTRRKTMMTNRRQIDLQAAQEDSTFLSALRRLATVPDTDEWTGEYYRKRLQYIDDELGKV